MKLREGGEMGMERVEERWMWAENEVNTVLKHEWEQKKEKSWHIKME